MSETSIGDTSKSTPPAKRAKIQRDKPLRKTFFGCDACRKRRVKCDLGKPFCNNCKRIKTECPGYGITLCWLSSPKFTKEGDLVLGSLAFKKENRLLDDTGGNTEHVKRRKVGFVKWISGTANEPYGYYEDMDQDLLILSNSETDVNVEKMGKTKLLGPFGVFSSHARVPSDEDGKTETAGTGTTNTGQKGTQSGKAQKVQGKAASRTTGPRISQRRPAGLSDYKSPSPVPRSNSPLSQEIGNEHLWLSNELRDDALLTAAALNGDSHLLDFMGSITPGAIMNSDHPSNTLTPLNYSMIHQTNNSHSTNPNEFLNLLFHKNNQGQTSNISSPNSSTLTPALGPTLPGGAPGELDLSHPDTSILIDPTNQHLYYSNYNNYFYDNPYKLNENLEIHLHASSKPNKSNEESTDLVEGQDHDQHVTKMPSSIMDIVQNPLQPKLGFNLLTPSSSSIGLPTTALQIQPLTRYLLNHYVTHVADLMTVLPLTESPWKTIYFPRALMAIGELAALGKTSTAKNALLNALLAVSAFNLQSKFPKNSDSMKYYLNLGISLRNQASLFIRKLLGSSSDTQLEIETCLKNEKYKDVLCAVMSMISVDLVWGTMQDTNFYIRWCGRVINTKMQNKKKLSPKAKVLHRIFSSLKIIQDSTCLNFDVIKYDYRLIDEQGYDINGENFIRNKKDKDLEKSDRSDKQDYPNKQDKQDNNDKNDKSFKGNIDYIVEKGAVNDDINPTPLFINKKLINTKHHNENFATDALYGLPNSLIKLFAATVRLIRRKIYIQHNKANVQLDGIEELARQLDTWKLDWKLFDMKDKKVFFSSMHEVTYHHIMSFYYALTIYFNRLVREQNPAELQDKVKMTLDHLNDIQRLIIKENVGIIPLFWQGFIAGCEAISPELQSSYKKWGADIAQYLGSYWGARQIMLEVWRRKRLNLGKDDWVGVINDWEMNLMLN